MKNILFLFADQHRQDCLGCYGNKIVKTPNIDRLAQNGVRFTNAVTPTATCTPARTSVQCGLLGHKHGVTFNPEWRGKEGGKLDVAPEIRFFSQDLKKKNWQLAHVGKWHIGNTNKPSDYGYEGVFYPGYGIPFGIMYNSPFIHKHYLNYIKKFGLKTVRLLEEKRSPTGGLYHGLQEGPQEVSTPGYLASQTVDRIKKYSKSKRPFFISFNFWGPHAPYNITEKHYRMYDSAVKDIKPWKNFNCDMSDKPFALRRNSELFRTDTFNEKNLAELIAKYYGYISLIDEEIGKIICALKETGQFEDTLIVYSADHGEHTGSYRMWDKGVGMYDTIYKIPFIVSNPALKQKTSDALVSLLDLAPTFLDLAGAKYSKDRFDGASLMPVLTGKKDDVREGAIVCETEGCHFKFIQRMVRTKTEKYIFNFTDKDEYYDLKKDPGEMLNIIDTVSKSKVRKMKGILKKWMIDTKDPLLRGSVYHLSN